MRAYALAARNWHIGVLVLILGLVPFAVNVVRAIHSTSHVGILREANRDMCTLQAVFGLGITGIVDPIFGCQGAATGLTPELAKRYVLAPP